MSSHYNRINFGTRMKVRMFLTITQNIASQECSEIKLQLVVPVQNSGLQIKPQKHSREVS